MACQPLELSDEVRSLLADRAATVAEGCLLLLPVRVDMNGVGQYREVHLTTPKELRCFKVPADFLQDSGHRIGLSEYSEDLVAAFAFGVVQNMTWDTAKATVHYLFARARQHASGDVNPKIEVQVARVSRRDGTLLEGVTVQGPANDTTAAELLRALVGDDPSPPPAT